MASTVAQKPTVVVVGATGKQGGAVVNALLDQGKFSVRALTRDGSSKIAKALAARQVVIAEGNLEDTSSLLKAFKGAYGVFLVTDAYQGGSSELDLGKHAVDAAKQAEIKHLVFSSLEDPRPVALGSLPEVAPGSIIPHFENKAEVAEYVKKSGVPYTILLTSIFYENFTTFLQYQKKEDGGYAFALNAGTKAHPSCSVEDIGASAAAAFASPETLSGKTVPVVGEHISYSKAAKTVSKVTGKSVSYMPLKNEQMASLPFPHAAEMANMFQYYDDHTAFHDLRPMDKTIVKGKPFAQWAEENAALLKSKLA